MNKFGFAYILAVLAVCIGRSPAFAEETGPGPYKSRICIDRPGESGRVNVVPVNIEILAISPPNVEGLVANLSIGGEEKVCLDFLGGGKDQQGRKIRTAIVLKYPYPYPGFSEPPLVWKAGRIFVDAEPGKTTNLLLCERSSRGADGQKWMETGWHNMWVLSPPENAKACD